MARSAPADQHQRDAVIAERSRNVVVDAGAGTGKTTLIVRRLVEMVAPQDDHIEAIPLGRIVAVTFTRKAAGELRLRVREEILRGMAERGLTDVRRKRLYNAIGAIDHAPIGTIHSFADRLLRMHPVEARLSPSYEIVEDAGELHKETFDLLITSVDRGTLSSDLAGTGAEGRALDASAVVRTAIEAGVLLESQEHDWGIRFGLDALIAGLLDHRDVPPPEAEASGFDRAAFVRCADEFVLRAKGSRGTGHGSRWLARSAGELRGLREEQDLARLYRRVVKIVDQGGKGFTKGVDFEDDEDGYKAWKAFDGDTRKNPVRATALRDDLMAPLHAWLGRQLVRLAPVVEALYEKVKTRRRVADPIDLLLRLRDVLVANHGVRAELQSLFDHLFIDEFQDTDPLQAEVMLLLAEDGVAASDPWAVKLASGRLTIVGDPKQSIYRFRRADVATYDRVRKKIAETDPLEATLSVNFRSTRGLVYWFNDRFAKVLGKGDEGARFDVSTGQVFHAPLEPAPDARAEKGVKDVEVIAIDAQNENAPEARALEAAAIARYLRWLVAESGTEVSDPLTNERRAIRYGDVAVLALITTNLPMLCRAFDVRRVPYTTSGGKLFASDGLHQQFLLALRALADREDGIAEAALLRPPFFAVDLADLALARDPALENDARVQRVRAAQGPVRELRRDRATRSPGATARDLLERTAIGRDVALGANGAQRLRRLREVCVELDAIASRQGLDFDGATYVMRQWVGAPPALDPPRPVDDAAVRVSSVHQAKGLEFPVVVLWDARGDWDTRSFTPPWAVDRETRAWALKIEPGLAWDEPPGAAFAEREQRYRDAERQRLVYVAATRAREKLVIATSSDKDRYVHTTLAAQAPLVEARVERWPVFRHEDTEGWPKRGRPAAQPREDVEIDEDASELDSRVASGWRDAIVDAKRARLMRVAASGLAKQLAERAAGDEWQDGISGEDEEDREPPRAPKARTGRFGPVFGDTVHRAMGLVLERGLAAPAAVQRAALKTGLTEHLDEAVDDVERTVTCLREQGIVRSEYRLEYPVAIDEGAPDGSGLLVVGSIDFLGVDGERLDVIDFKTDRAPQEGERAEETHGEYVAQVAAYARMLERTGVSAGKKVRRGLLFTERGRVWWV
jgi:ATP-dependent helicase/nuclease subunit A